MCLRLAKGYAEIAEEDIVCYKLLRYDPSASHESKYVTPFQGYPVSTFVIEGKLDWIPTYFCGDVNTIFLTWTIDVGAVHSCKTLDEAKQLKEWFAKERQWMEIRIFKCHIPKGKRYFVGLDEWNFGGYASESLMFDEEIK